MSLLLPSQHLHPTKEARVPLHPAEQRAGRENYPKVSRTRCMLKRTSVSRSILIKTFTWRRTITTTIMDRMERTVLLLLMVGSLRLLRRTRMAIHRWMMRGRVRCRGTVSHRVNRRGRGKAMGSNKLGMGRILTCDGLCWVVCNERNGE